MTTRSEELLRSQDWRTKIDAVAEFLELEGWLTYGAIVRSLEDDLERRTLLQVRSFITRHGTKEVDAYCAQRLHDIMMDAQPPKRAPSASTIAAAAMSGTLDELRPLPGEE